MGFEYEYLDIRFNESKTFTILSISSSGRPFM